VRRASGWPSLMSLRNQTSFNALSVMRP